jgi:hypothetical protein
MAIEPVIMTGPPWFSEAWPTRPEAERLRDLPGPRLDRSSAKVDSRQSLLFDFSVDSSRLVATWRVRRLKGARADFRRSLRNLLFPLWKKPFSHGLGRDVIRFCECLRGLGILGASWLRHLRIEFSGAACLAWSLNGFLDVPDKTFEDRVAFRHIQQHDSLELIAREKSLAYIAVTRAPVDIGTLGVVSRSHKLLRNFFGIHIHYYADHLYA